MWSGGWGVSVSTCLLNFRMFFFWAKGKGKGKVAIGKPIVGWLSLRLSKLVRSLHVFFFPKKT